MVEGGGKHKVTGFSATGILGETKYRLNLDGPAAIIVGPNGTGKSTFLSLFYLFLSRQWPRVNEYEFDTLTLHHTGGDISIRKIDAVTFEQATPRLSSAGRYLNRLVESNRIDLIYKTSLTREERSEFSALTGIPPSRISAFRSYAAEELGLTQATAQADKAIQELGVGTILYLPTYRRIEKDIKSIFPDIEERFRTVAEHGAIPARTGKGFREIVSFGMADVQDKIQNFCDEIKEFQRLASDSASQGYILDIVQGNVKDYSLARIRRLPETDFDEFKERLDDKLFSAKDRERFKAKITALRKPQKGKPTAELTYLGLFVEKLLSAHQSVKERERPLREFADMVSMYLGPTKHARLVGHSFAIVDSETDRDIPLHKLSSGEKQILSVFAYLYLSRNEKFFLFIDEPELSLSVPWQKTFLPHILDSGSCECLVSVTHSPFVFDNDLRSRVVDVRKLRYAPND